MSIINASHWLSRGRVGGHIGLARKQREPRKGMRKWTNCKIKRWERKNSESLKRIFSCFLAWIPYLVRAFPQVGSMCKAALV